MSRIVVSLAALAACTETRPSDIIGTQSFAVTLVTPSDPGAPDRRLPDTARAVSLDVEARDADNQLDSGFNGTLQVYAQFLGTLTPEFGRPPLTTIGIVNGRGLKAFDLPNVFGPTVLWVDNGSGEGPNYVHGDLAGTSPTLWFRDPFIVDMQQPPDETAVNALSSSPLQDKQITVGGPPGSTAEMTSSRYGARGRLVVTSVFAQGYTVSDVQCADAAGTPPCTTQSYDHAMVFSFSAPRDQEFDGLEIGQVISGFGGGVSEFLGLTEIGFPRTFSARDPAGKRIVDVARLPPPVAVDPATWFRGLNDPNGEINFERNEAALIQIDNVIVCDLDSDYDKRKQWKADPSGVGGNCKGRKDLINVVTTGLAGIDPPSLVGRTLPRVTGILRPVFDTWIIFPRSPSDVTQ